MTAPTPAEAAKGLAELAHRVEVTGHVPEQCWPLVFRPPLDVRSAEAVQAFAASLGIEDGELQGAEEEDGSYWFRLRGHVGGVRVDVMAEGDPVLEGGSW